MKIFITLLILIMPVIVRAGTVGQYIIFTSSFSQVAFDNMIQYAVNGSKDKGQNALRVSWVTVLSTDIISSTGTVRTRLEIRRNYRDNKPYTDNNPGQIWMTICVSVENFHPIENFISQGKIKKVGTVTFNRKGWNRTEGDPQSIYAGHKRYKEWKAGQ